MWIGVECGVDGYELMKWAKYIKECGGERVGEYLERSADAQRQTDFGKEEVSENAAVTVERIRKNTRERTERIIRNVLGRVDVGAVMRSLGMSGELPEGMKGSAVRTKKRKNTPSVIRDGDGNPVIVASAQGRAVKSSIMKMLKKDEIYAMMNEARLADELMRGGLHMYEISHITGLTKGDAWRMAVGYGRYWKRMEKSGKFPPDSREYAAYRKERILKSGIHSETLEKMIGTDNSNSTDSSTDSNSAEQQMKGV